MAEFRCKNCGEIFNKFCDTVSDSINVECPSCGSHWVEPHLHPPREEPVPFPKLPYFDPPTSPVKYWYMFAPPIATGRIVW